MGHESGEAAASFAWESAISLPTTPEWALTFRLEVGKPARVLCMIREVMTCKNK